MPTLADCLKSLREQAPNIQLGEDIERQLLSDSRGLLRRDRERIKNGLITSEEAARASDLAAVDSLLQTTTGELEQALTPPEPTPTTTTNEDAQQETAEQQQAPEQTPPPVDRPQEQDRPPEQERAAEGVPQGPEGTQVEPEGERITPEQALEDPELTSIKNEATDRELERLGYDPIAGPASKADAETWGKARSAAEADPALGSRLVEELNLKPRAIDDEQHGVLLHELAGRKVAAGRATEAYFKAVNSGADGATVAAHKAVLDEARLKVVQNIAAAKKAGTEAGRALRFRRMFIDQDYSLVALSALWQSEVNGGKPLSPEQEQTVANLAESLKQAQAQVDILEEENTELVSTLDRLVQDVEKAQKKAARKDTTLHKRVTKWLDAEAVEARKHLAEVGMVKPPGEEDVTELAAGLPSSTGKTIKALAVIGAQKLNAGATSLGDFTAAMVKDFGKPVLEVIEKVYQQSRSLWIGARATALSQGLTTETAESVTQGVDPQSVVDSIDPEGGPTHKDVWNLARAHVIQGKRGSHVLDAVETDLKAEFPDFTREDVATAFTNYGQVTYPSKDKVKKELSRVRELERIALKIADLKAGQPPKLTGKLRDKPDAEIRALEKEFRKLYKESNIEEVQANQAATALGTAKRRMLNEIEELQLALDAKTPRTTSDRGAVELDEEGTQLKAQLEAKRAEYQETFGEEMTTEKRVELAIRALDRRIAEEEQMIKDGVFERPKGEPLPDTPELTERRRKLADLRAERRRLDPKRSPLEQAKESARESIQRYMNVLATGEIALKERTPVDPDAELEALWEVRKALSDEVREQRKALPDSPAKEKAKIRRALKAAEDNLKRVQRKLDTNDLSTKPKRESAASRDAAVRKVREQAKELNKELARRRRAAEPKEDPEEARIKRRLKAIERSRKDLERRLRERDFAPKAKPKPITDGRVKEAQRELNRWKKDVHTAMLEAKKADRTRTARNVDLAMDLIVNTPRAILTSYDAGAFGRQGWLAFLTRPGVTAGQFSKNFTWTEAGAEKAQQDIESDPDHQAAVDAKLALTEWGPGHSLRSLEEMFRSEIARKVPGIAQSERAYVSYLNAVRFAHFKVLKAALEGKEGGLTTENLKQIAHHINALTGRGDLDVLKRKGQDIFGTDSLPGFEKHAEALAGMLFSPKYWMSRLQVLGGIPMSAVDAVTGWRLGPEETKIARKIIAMEHARLTAGLVAQYSLIGGVAAVLNAMAGEGEPPVVEVGFDPRSTDFGKIKFSNGTRIDTGAGLLQNMTFIAQMATGQKVSSFDGEVKDWRGEDKNFESNIGKELGKMLRKKLAPVWGAATNLSLGKKDLFYRDTTVEGEMVGLAIPLVVGEIYESYRDLGLSKTAAVTMLNLFGFGSATYGADGSDDTETTLERDLARWIGVGIFAQDPEKYEFRRN